MRRTAWLFVAAQFALLGLIVFLPGGDAWSAPAWLGAGALLAIAAGLVTMAVAGLGLGRGLTAAPLPNEHARLRTGGLYALVRHPIYSGLLLFCLGEVLRSRSEWVAVAGVLLVALINVKARWEEHRLAEHFPDYPDYSATTPRFIPRPWARA